MPIDNLPGRMIVPLRDEVRDTYLRDYRLRNPGALTVEGTQAFIDASVFADSMLPVYADVTNLGNYAAGVNRAGKALDEDARRLGTARLGPTGASGYVQVGTSVGGGTIYLGDEIRVGSTRYQCAATALYTNLSYVPVAGVDTGPGTNQPAGTVMTWSAPRPGIAPTATVVMQADGSGLSNGRNGETDAELDQRLIQLRANPPASGNDADVQATMLQTPGVFMQQPFTYPGIAGPGTTGVTFTLRPSGLGGNRIPNAAQRAAVLAYLVGQFPPDQTFFSIFLLAQPVPVALQVSWGVGAVGWADGATWPAYQLFLAAVTSVTSATSFVVTSAGTPSSGQSIALYDKAAATFRRKQILTATGGPTAWTITCDTTNGVSDLNYTPVVNQAVCPWSDSLQSIVPAVQGYFDTLGPGENTGGTLVDPGYRQRRSPRSPQWWPHVITTRLIAPVFDVPTVQDVALLQPTPPYDTVPGGATVSSNLMTLGDLVAYP